MNTIDKTFETSKATDDKGNPKYVGGEIKMEVPKLSEWAAEDLDAFGEWVARQLIHYGPSQAYKSAKGEIEKLDSADGRYLCKDGVFSINPEWRTGDKSAKAEAAYQKRLEKKVAELEAKKGRPLTDAELEIVEAVA